MTAAEGFAGFIASVIAIITALILCIRYLERRFDKWAEALVENSHAMRNLSARVSRLENTIKKWHPADDEKTPE